jgi:ArsR family transcriptional regulator
MITPDDTAPAPLDVDQVTRDIAAGIAPAFAGILSPRTLEGHVSEVLHRLVAGATVPDYLRLLTWRVVNEQLRGVLAPQASASMVPTEHKPTVLLACAAAPALGAVAAAMLDELAGGTVGIRVAGATGEPLPGELAAALRARAVGTVPAVHPRPVPLDRDAIVAADVVVTLTGEDACPVVRGPRYLDWQLTTPSPDDADGAAAVVEAIRVRAASLLELLGPRRLRRRVIPL